MFEHWQKVFFSMLFLSISGTQTKARQRRGEGGVEGNKEIFLVFVGGKAPSALGDGRKQGCRSS